MQPPPQSFASWHASLAGLDERAAIADTDAEQFDAGIGDSNQHQPFAVDASINRRLGHAGRPAMAP